MTIKRDDIDKRKIDFSDVRSGRRLPPVHPGEILRDEFLTPMGISVYELANAIKVPCSRPNDIVLGRCAITTDTAMRLGRYFGMSPEFWINLHFSNFRLDERTNRRPITSSVLSGQSPEVWRELVPEREYRTPSGSAQCGGLLAKSRKYWRL